MTIETTNRNTGWRIAALAMLAVRFTQGFIYWGGGSRRFIYAPSKLDPSMPHWMAHKLQSAMPGALLGTDQIIAWLLHHFAFLYAGLIIFSLLELLCGLGLVFGLLTRLAAFGSAAFSIVLMLTFGWQGATCIDEWTMAACNLAMGATIMLAGSGALSLDNVLLEKKPQLAEKRWFRWVCGSLPLPLADKALLKLSLVTFWAVATFNVGTYSYYRGAVVTAYHEGPTNPSKHHFTVNNVRVGFDGTVRFHIALDGGTPEAPAHVMAAMLQDAAGKTVEEWDFSDLAHIAPAAVRNDFLYNVFKTTPFGLSAEMGASANITLLAKRNFVTSTGPFRLLLTDIESRTFTSGHSRVLEGSVP